MGKYLGFALPDEIVEAPESAERMDSYPRPGFCVRCKRSKPWTYEGAIGRVCYDDISDQVRVQDKRGVKHRRNVFRGEGYDQPEREALSPKWSFDTVFWDRWFR